MKVLRSSGIASEGAVPDGSVLATDRRRASCVRRLLSRGSFDSAGDVCVACMRSTAEHLVVREVASRSGTTMDWWTATWNTVASPSDGPLGRGSFERFLGFLRYCVSPPRSRGSVSASTADTVLVKVVAQKTMAWGWPKTTPLSDFRRSRKGVAEARCRICQTPGRVANRRSHRVGSRRSRSSRRRPGRPAAGRNRRTLPGLGRHR